MRIAAIVVILVMLSILSGLAYGESVSPALREQTPHGVIKVNSDSELDSLASSEGWTGSGTQGDPYIIENYEIDAQGGGAAIYLGNTTKYVLIRNCLVYNATNSADSYGRGSGIMLYGAQNVTVSNVTSRDNIYGIFIYQIYGRNNVVENSTFIGNTWGAYLYFLANNNTIRDNLFEGKYYGVGLKYEVAHNRIVGNSIYNASDYAIYVDGSFGASYQNEISGNVLKWGDTGIRIVNGDYQNTYENNTIMNFTYGIYIESDVHDDIFSNNTIQYCDDGIYISNGNSGDQKVYGNLISGNEISETKNEAIFTNGYYGGVENNRFLDNRISSPGYYGIYLYESSNNRIENNTIQDATYYGIRLYGNADDNFIYGNLIVRSGNYGIHIASSSGNLIYNNSFYYNHGSTDTYDSANVQAYDSDGGNFWNSTTEGNYWADWTTPDGNGDGIVDNPYVLDGGAGAQDSYPLTEPGVPVPEFSMSVLLAIVLLLAFVVRRRF